MNVALGGSLYQDLATQGFSAIQHSQKAEPPVLGHSVEQTGNSPLNRLFEPRFRANSYHPRPSRTWPQGCTPLARRRMAL
jgi:putative glutamine amidotransferase